MDRSAPNNSIVALHRPRPRPIAREPEARSSAPISNRSGPLAQQRGVTPATFDRALTNVPYDTEVSRLSRKQPEYGRPVGAYLNSLVAQPRIGNGIKRIGELRGLLDSIEHRFGVPREVIVAIWGVETSYGANQGGKRVIPSARNARLPQLQGRFLARDELITALLILQEGHIPPERMIWAGDGQPQFIASSFMRWAVDFLPATASAICGPRYPTCWPRSRIT